MAVDSCNRLFSFDFNNIPYVYVLAFISLVALCSSTESAKMSSEDLDCNRNRNRNFGFVLLRH